RCRAKGVQRLPKHRTSRERAVASQGRGGAVLRSWCFLVPPTRVRTGVDTVATRKRSVAGFGFAMKRPSFALFSLVCSLVVVGAFACSAQDDGPPAPRGEQLKAGDLVEGTDGKT